MMFLHVRDDRDLPAHFRIPSGLCSETVCAASGKLPGPRCRKTIREWFFKERRPSEHCEVHRAFRYVNEEGEAVTSTFEVFPPEYSAWAEQQRNPVPPPDAIPVAMNEVSIPSDLALLTPQDGQLFKIDPVLRKEYQTIRITGRVPPDVSDVRVRLNNGRVLSYNAEGLWWQLQKGEHRFQLEGVRRGRLVRSAAVDITVH
jgi:hypothetical protein